MTRTEVSCRTEDAPKMRTEVAPKIEPGAHRFCTENDGANHLRCGQQEIDFASISDAPYIARAHAHPLTGVVGSVRPLVRRTEDAAAADAAPHFGADPATEHTSARYRDARTRRAAYAEWDAAYEAWRAAGSPGGPDAWPRPPAGLTSACLGAAMARPDKPGPKWGKR